MTIPDVKYYECHITVEPVFGERLELLNELAVRYQFRVANLLFQRRATETPTRSNKDSFCTGRDQKYDDMKTRMEALVVSMEESGFQVWRRKIEAVILDERTRKPE